MTGGVRVTVSRDVTLDYRNDARPRPPVLPKRPKNLRNPSVRELPKRFFSDDASRNPTFVSLPATHASAHTRICATHAVTLSRWSAIAQSSTPRLPALLLALTASPTSRVKMRHFPDLEVWGEFRKPRLCSCLRSERSCRKTRSSISTFSSSL